MSARGCASLAARVPWRKWWGVESSSAGLLSPELPDLLPTPEEVEGRHALDPQLLHDGLRVIGLGTWKGARLLRLLQNVWAPIKGKGKRAALGCAAPGVPCWTDSCRRRSRGTSPCGSQCTPQQLRRTSGGRAARKGRHGGGSDAFLLTSSRPSDERGGWPAARVFGVRDKGNLWPFNATPRRSDMPPAMRDLSGLGRRFGTQPCKGPRLAWRMDIRPHLARPTP